MDGGRPDLKRELRGAHASSPARALGMLSGPVYIYMSNAGRIFVPEFDRSFFTPLRPVGTSLRIVQWATQRAFGIRAPASRFEAS